MKDRSQSMNTKSPTAPNDVPRLSRSGTALGRFIWIWDAVTWVTVPT
jgi:hypothetical protein